MFSVKQIFPVYYEGQVSRRLLEASYSGDLSLVLDCISDPSVDVNFVGAVTLKTRSSELVLIPESSSQVSFGFKEFLSDVTPLFLAVHARNASLVRKLLVMTNETLVFSSFISFIEFLFLVFQILKVKGEEKVTSILNFLSVALLFMVIGPHFTFSPFLLL